ncbi:hypothetical protein Bca101_059251 [Brassica carinata]
MASLAQSGSCPFSSAIVTYAQTRHDSILPGATFPNPASPRFLSEATSQSSCYFFPSLSLLTFSQFQIRARSGY